jgi:WD40 repeat protein
MINSPALTRVLDAGVPLAAHEAVAIAQQTIYNRVTVGEPIEPAEVAAVLDQLLPPGSETPAALRYTVARARGDVAAPPFESTHDFVLALKRFEIGDRATVVRDVLARVQAPRRSRVRPIVAVAAIAVSAVIGAVVGPRVSVQGPRAGARLVPDTVPGTSQAPSQVAAVPGGSQAPRPTAAVPGSSRAPAAPPVVRAVARDRWPEFSPAFADNGTAVFFHTGHAPSEPSALKAIDGLDGGLRVMTILDDGARNYHVQPSPDGSQIAFDSDRDGERAIYVARRDGSDVRRVTTGPYSAVPTWSPDGTRIAFIRTEPDRPQVWNLWLLTLASGETRRLTDFRYGQTWSASWFRDGRQIAYTHETRLVILDLETGAERDFHSPIRGRLVRTPAVSPDGAHVIFQVAGSGAWLLDLRDEEMRCVLTDATAEEFAWSPDGTRVAFHSRRDGQWGIWIMAPAAITADARTPASPR